MKDLIFHDSPPPCVGWYNASTARDPNVWRWWDGVCWSLAVHRTAHSTYAGEAAKSEALSPQKLIQWSTYWPENARVPDTRNLKGYK